MDLPRNPRRRVVDGPTKLSFVRKPAGSFAPKSDVLSVAGQTVNPAVFNYKKNGAKKRLWQRLPKFRFSKKTVLISLGVLAALLLIIFGIKLLLATHRIITRNNDGGAPALSGDIDPTKLRGEGDGRINILLLGIGGAGHEGGNLSDTIMVISIDPRTKDVAMLGIPRDLYVPIPGYGSTKVNAAHAYGEIYDYEGGGPALAKKTLENVLDVPIHYYARIDFTGFKKAIDAIGGIDIDVKEALYDPEYPDERRPGRTKILNIKTGQQHMDGERALEYVRSRKSTSDFDRARRQQEVLQAVRNKALSLKTLSNPAKIISLIDIVGDHFKTDFQIYEIKKLAEIAIEIDETKIVNKVLDTTPEGLLNFASIAGSGSVEVPRAGIGNFSEIQELVHSIFVDHYLKDEAATLEVQNGTTRSGLATTVGDMLKRYQYNVVRVVTADNQNYPTTVIYDHTGGKKPYTIKYLEARFGVTAKKSDHTEGGPDVTVIVGADYRIR